MTTDRPYGLSADPLGMALRDHFAGTSTHQLELVVPSVNKVWTQDVSGFFVREPANDVEEAVLAAARGRVLDIGAGAGRASLLLQARGHEVLAIDISAGAVEVMRQRGVTRALCRTWAEQLRDTGEVFDTVLMFNRGFGLVGTPDGLRAFLRQARGVLAEGGQVLGDWREPPVDRDEGIESDERSTGSAHDRNPYFRREMWVRYGATTGAPFEWLESTFEELQRVAAAEGWQASLLRRGADGYAVTLAPGN